MPSFQPHFEVAFDVDPDAEPASGDWTDLTEDVMDYEVVYGRLGDGDLASVLLADPDRNYDPTNSSSPYNLIPMRHARVTATISGTTYDLWRGYVDTWPPRWPGYNEAEAEVGLVDATAWAGLQDTDVDLDEQWTHERIVALLDDAGWPAARRDIGDGVVRVEAWAQEGANLLRVLQDTADAEDGTLYIDPDGSIVFRSRHHRFDATVQATARTDGDSDIGVTAVSPEWGATDLTNVARVELADGTVYEVRDEASIATYGPRYMSIRDLPLPWHEANGLADWDVHRYAQPKLALSSLTFENPSASEMVLIVQRKVGDLVEFRHQPPGGGAEVQMQGHIERVRHTIGQEWQTQWEISPYFGEGPWITLDDATLGQLDSGNQVAP